jgi:undecaprenyl-diphosphatase
VSAPASSVTPAEPIHPYPGERPVKQGEGTLVEYSVEQWINQTVHAHPLLSAVVVEFSTWGVTVFGVLAVGLWLLSPPGDTLWKRACAAGLGSAALGLGVNQVISHLWARARPYEAHHAIVPLLHPSADPSFPSDHATAALSIAFGVFFVSHRAGWLFLGFASLVAVSRVLAGMHYPSDVLASLVVSAAAGFVMARLLMLPVLAPLVKLVSRLTDPLLSSLAGLAAIRRTALSPLFRSRLVAVVCAVIFVRIVIAERAQLLDELPILVLAAWTFLTVVSVQLAARRYWPQ